MDPNTQPPAPNQSPDTPLQPLEVEPPTTMAGATSAEPQPVTAPPKKSRKPLIIGGIITGAIVVLVGSTLALLFIPRTSSTPSKDRPAQTSKTDGMTDNATVNSFTSSIGNGLDTESSTVTTDDSSVTSDIDKAMTNIGDSVDENNF